VCVHERDRLVRVPVELGSILAKTQLFQEPDPELGKIVSGVFTPVLDKHSKAFSLIDCVSVGVDRMQRSFDRCASK
jgi:hypothetical protein